MSESTSAPSNSKYRIIFGVNQDTNSCVDDVQQLRTALTNMELQPMDAPTAPMAVDPLSEASTVHTSQPGKKRQRVMVGKHSPYFELFSVH